MHTGVLLLDTELLEQPNLNTELVQLYNLLLVFLAQLLLYLLIVGNPNRKKMHIFRFVGIFEYIC